MLNWVRCFSRIDWRLITTVIALLVVAFLPIPSDTKHQLIGAIIALDRLSLARWTRIVGRQISRDPDPRRRE